VVEKPFWEWNESMWNERKGEQEMNDHKFTDEEVIKALECCKRGYCIDGKCPLLDWNDYDDISRCTGTLATIALDLINRQKAEIHALTSAVDNSTQEFLKLHDTYQEQKAEIAMKNAEINAYSISKKFDAEYFNADIKKLEKENAELRMENNILATEYAERVRAEAIQEFAERLTNRIMDKLDASDNAPDGDFYFITDVYTDIDDLVKEMTEEKTNAK
jgi:hypothetical protein